jgi:hypothetical protein
MARRTSTERGVVLSHLEFDLLWEDLDLGDPPYPIEVPSHGETMAARDELGEQVFATLAEAGLVIGDDVHPELRESLELLVRNTLSIDALIFGEVPLRLLAVSDGGQALLAVLDNQELALEPLHVDGVLGAVSSVIGDVPPGPGEQVRLPREVFTAAMDAHGRSGYAAFEGVLADAGITGRSVRPLATMVASKRVAAGQLAVNAVGARSPVLSWFDTEAGRYAVSTEDVGGQRLSTVTPADGGWIRRRIESIVDALRRG